MIRKAEPDDVAAIRRIAEAAYDRYLPRLNKPPAPMVADFARHVSEDEVFVFEADGSMVGYAILILTAERALLDNIAVDPAAQGKGVGRTLIEEVQRRARAAGHDALELYTNVVMTENLDWYAKLGFVETRRVTEKGFNRVYMRKAVGEAHDR